MKRLIGVLFTLMLVFSLAAIGLSSPVQAAVTFTVNSTHDDVDWNPGDGVAETAPGNGVCTLRAAIQETNALAGPDTINLPAGTYLLSIAGADEDASATGDLDIADDLTITGADQATTIIDGGGLDRVFDVHSGSTVEISGVTVQNGSLWYGAGIRNNSTLTLTSSTVSGNTGAHGGGIYNRGTLTLINSTVTRNTSAAFGGGGIYSQGTLTVTGSTITTNVAGEGGGINIRTGTATITNTIISDNTGGGGSGGGINIAIDTTLTLTGSTVHGNSARFGGGMFINQRSVVALSDSTVSNNMASTDGGGIYIDRAEVTMSDSYITGNVATSRYGGGIVNGGILIVTSSTVSDNVANSGGGILNGGDLTLTESIVSSNTAYVGAGILGDRGTITLNDSTIRDNTAVSRGGGMRINGSVTTVNGSTISGNAVSAGTGGGIHNTYPLTLTNSTISGNSANVGGGIYNSYMLGSLTLTNVTVNDNSATDGGGIYFGDGDVTLKNSIVANNTGGDFGGAGVTSLGHNLDSDGTGGLSGPGDISGVDPLVGPLADNGGPTFTHALLPGSPAIDAGDNIDCPATDQRGVTRPLDGDGDGNPICDIGAYEYEPPTEPVVEATVDFDPDTLNLKSKGKVVTVYIELPEGYDVEEIDISTVMLNGIVPAWAHPTDVGDYDSDGVSDLMVKFDRSDVQDVLEPGNEVEVTVSGQLTDGTTFEGTDTIRVIEKEKK